MGIYKTIGLQHDSNSQDHVSLSIAAINARLIGLSWLDTCFGEAEIRLINGNAEPMVFRAIDEGSGTPKAEYFPVRPTREFGKAFSFFNPVIETDEANYKGVSNYFSSASYELIVFCNLDAINATKGSRFERELAKEVRVLLQNSLGQAKVTDVTTIYSEVYAGYDFIEWGETLTQHPYAAFKISIQINETTEC